MLLIFIVLPIIVSLIGYILPVKFTKVLLFITSVSLFAYALVVFFDVRNAGIVVNNLGGYESWQGINLVADNISILLLVLTTFLFMLLFLYNYHKPYMVHLFMFLFMLLEGLICAIFLVDDLFSLYVLIEVSTVCVAILIMYKKSNQSIYDGLVYLLINIVAMTFYLLGIGYIYKIFGTLNLGVLKQNMHLVKDLRQLIIPYSLIVTAIGLKSAIMPLFSWLPKAHGTPSAPSIVSAILSGLYVKGGIYLLIRIGTVFSSVIDVSDLFVFLGFSTAIIGFVLALSQIDIKLILAYHTVSQIGLIIFGLSLSSDYSYYGAIYHIINHAVFKSTLFLTAGIVYDEYKTRDIRQIRGVFKRMPYVAVIMVIAILGITGAPLFNGSVSKYLISKGTIRVAFYEIVMFIINIGTIISFVKYSSMLVGKSDIKAKTVINMKIATGILAFITFLGGVFGQNMVQYLFGVQIHITSVDIMKKLGVYLISLGVGFFFYKFLYPKISFFKKIRAVELSFNGIVFSIVVFFVSFSGYLYFTM